MFHVEHHATNAVERPVSKQQGDRGRPAASRLGRGLGSLIPVPIQKPAPQPAVAPVVATEVKVVAPAATPPASPPALPPRAKAADPNTPTAAPDPGAVQFIATGSIRPGKYQPRGSMDPQALDALAASIEASGLMQPVVVRPTSELGVYELIAGERRWRAMTRLGRAEIPAIVREAGDHEAAELALIENLQREDLNPMDRAAALRRLSDEFGLTHQQLAARVGLDRVTVSNLLRLNELDAHVAGLVRAGSLTLGHAKCLLGVPDLAVRRALADACVAGDWSVRQLEAKVREGTIVPRGTRAGGGARSGGSAHLSDLQRQLEQHLGTRVQVRVGRKKGAGELRIQFFSLDEFDGLMARIGFRGNNLIV